MTRTIVIGDIHGCYDELVALLKKVDFTSTDRVVAVGDLIVKGRKNRQVLDLFSSDPRFSSVIGNHDLAVLNFLRGDVKGVKQSQKVAALELTEDKDRYIAYLSTLPFLIDLNSHAVVHAGVRPGIPLTEQLCDDLLELRTLGADRTNREGIPWYDVYEGEKTILFGHWPAPVPRRAKCAIGLDTGCVYGHELTAYILEIDQFVQVSAGAVYDVSSRKFKRSERTKSVQ